MTRRVLPVTWAWMADAACQGLDPNLFFPRQGDALGPVKVVCAACAVRAECREFALADPTLRGVWGGLSDRERRQLRLTRVAAA